MNGVLVSPNRTKRPWQGKKDKPQEVELLDYDPNCYLCPGNERAGGAKNPDYTGTQPSKTILQPYLKAQKKLL